MHIPDGLLDTKTWVTAWVASGCTLGVAVRSVRRGLSDSRIVLMAVLAALVFALQMLNFPVAAGTSGHFTGGAAAAIILGPWPAVVVMSTVVIVQALVFADGGVTALGANLLNMAVIAPFVGWWVFGVLGGSRGSRRRASVASFASAWAATVAAAVAAGAMLWVSGRAPALLVMGSMGFWHALIGIGEGVITAGLVGYILAVRPDIMRVQPEMTRIRGVAIAFGLAALAAVGVSFLASARPDGLEYVSERLEIVGEPMRVLGGLAPDYVLPGVSNEMLAGLLAGAVGVILTGVLLYAALSGARQRKGAISDVARRGR